MKRKHNLWMFVLIVCMAFIFPDLKAEETKPTLAASSAILIDASSKTVLYEKDGYSTHYPASITKLMTALLAIERLEPTDIITFSHDAIFSIESNSSHIGMDVGEQITVDEALHGLLLMSANEVANGLAEAVSGSTETFSHLMTERAKELGALNTNFVNPHGLHDDNHYTTAYDMALIGSYLADNEYFLSIMQDTTYQIAPTNKADEMRYLYQQHTMLNPTRDPKVYREDVIGGKTGYTDQARHTLVTIAKQGDTTLVAVVLESEKSTLYSDTASLLDYGFNSYHALTLHEPGDAIKTLPLYSVKSGKLYQAGNCSISVQNPLSVLVSGDTTLTDLKTSVDLPEYIDVSARVGEVIGTITYLKGSEILGKNNLVIENIAHDSSSSPTKLPTKSTWRPVYTYILIGLLGIFLMLCLVKRKRRKKKLKDYKKLKFAKHVK